MLCGMIFGMKIHRLEGLSDGIFAIVMTILVFEIRVPSFFAHPTNQELWFEIVSQTPALLSYILSFALLFTYWRAHHFFTSVYAKNIDTKLTNINALFFMLVALIPFSTSLLGEYSANELSVVVFGVHIILIGLSIYWMRRYVLYSPHIKNPAITQREVHGSTIRTLVPVVMAAIAIPLAFADAKVSITLLTLAVLFNLSSASTRILMKVFK